MLHVVLVCHSELDFEGRWNLYERVQPEMERIFARVADAVGKKPRVTYCLTNAFLTERLDEAFRFIDDGHEIGIHSHLPGAQRFPNHRYDGPYAYRFDEAGFLNQDRIAGPLREVAIALGLPAPVSHVSGMFTFQPRTVEMLVEAGFRVDCSLLPGAHNTHRLTGDFVLADNRRHPDFYPYHPALNDPWMEGTGPLVELPVSGNLGGGSIDNQIVRMQERARAAQESGTVDVFQSFWHHFEFVDLGWTRGTFEDAERFLMECGRTEGVLFSTAAEAAAAFEEA